MTLNDYQSEAATTAIYPKNYTHQGVYYTALGLAGEAGEVANKIKKIMRDNGNKITPDVEAAIMDELGDVLWYSAGLATELGVKLSDIATRNLVKLHRRHNQEQEEIK